jgi:hypothetical protein
MHPMQAKKTKVVRGVPRRWPLGSFGGHEREALLPADFRFDLRRRKSFRFVQAREPHLADFVVYLFCHLPPRICPGDFPSSHLTQHVCSFYCANGGSTALLQRSG